MVQIVSDTVIIMIDAFTSVLFALSVAFSFVGYKKTSQYSNIWLMIGIMFAFLSTNAVSNVLEWAKITAALDPAEDFLNILVIFILCYIFYYSTKSS